MLRRLLLAALALTMLTAGGWASIHYLARRPIDVPDSKTPGANSIIVAANGKTLTQLQAPGGSRIPLPPEKITPIIRDTIVAAEDMRFYEHDGVDDKAAARALLKDARERDFIEGASTLTMQLVNLRYLDPNDDSRKRKETQARLAAQLERDLSKSLGKSVTKTQVKYQVETDYANEAPFCAAAGVEAASQVYFGHSLGTNKKQELVEAATLAAILRAPCDYTQPTPEDKAHLHARRNYVLENLRTLITKSYHQSQITPTQIDAAQTAADLPMTVNTGSEPYLANLTRITAGKLLGAGDTANPNAEADTAFAQGGMKIETTINYDLQKQLPKFVDANLKGTGLKTGVTLIEPKTGALVAYYGGDAKTYAEDGFDYAMFSPGRRGGSSSKVFTLVDCLKHGCSPDSKIPSPATYPSGETEPFKNTSECTKQGVYTIREATIKSCNTAFLAIISGKTPEKNSQKLIPLPGSNELGMGPQTTADLTLALGANQTITGVGEGAKLAPVPSLTLGTSPMTVFQRDRAFATVLNHGSLAGEDRGDGEPLPFFIKKISQSNKVLWEHKAAKSKEIVKPVVADTALNILFDVTGPDGTAKGQTVEQPTGYKTGTDVRDATALQGNDNLGCSVWRGFKNNDPIIIRANQQVHGADVGWICRDALEYAFKNNAKQYTRHSLAPAANAGAFTKRIGV